METGQFVYQVADAHGPSTEITAMTVDSSGYRLATGGYNGGYTYCKLETEILNSFIIHEEL